MMKAIDGVERSGTELIAFVVHQSESFILFSRRFVMEIESKLAIKME